MNELFKKNRALIVTALAAGATLVQIYTGLIYSGPQLISDCVNAFSIPDA